MFVVVHGGETPRTGKSCMQACAQTYRTGKDAAAAGVPLLVYMPPILLRPLRGPMAESEAPPAAAAAAAEEAAGDAPLMYLPPSLLRALRGAVDRDVAGAPPTVLQPMLAAEAGLAAEAVLAGVIIDSGCGS